MGDDLEGKGEEREEESEDREMHGCFLGPEWGAEDIVFWSARKP